jgi:SAM-dependent methyltransferase
MNYERAVEHAPPGWRKFVIEDLERLPAGVREHEMRSVPDPDRRLIAGRDREAIDRVLRAFFWTFVYHLEPAGWDALAEVEPIHPQLLAALPRHARRGVDIGAGSGRLTRHLASRCDHVVGIEPAAGLRELIKQRLPTVEVVAGWADALPLQDRCSDLTAGCGVLGPEPDALRELERVTAIGGLIALISPECPEWFEGRGWRRVALARIAPPDHERWIDEFFGPPDPPHELIMKRVTT